MGLLKFRRLFKDLNKPGIINMQFMKNEINHKSKV